jgi:hypothetical protein
MPTYNSFKRIDSEAIVDGAVTAADVADNAAIAGKFATDAITAPKIGTGQVGATQLGASVDLSGRTVTYRTIVDGDISASAAITSDRLASGAITTNLGYTPLANNNANSMTGVLRVPNGSAAAPAIQSAAQSNTGIYFDSANNVVFSVAGAERMRINANGHKTIGTDSTTGSIMWLASGTSGWTYANSYGGYGWRETGGGMGWDVYQRGGSNFSTGNGRFTAPVSAFYHLTWQSYNYNDDNNTPNYIHQSFSRNGDINSWSGRAPHGMWMHGSNANHAGGVSMSLDLYLNAGEYTSQFFFWAGGPSRVHGSHSIFAGYMIG